jgi:hypothetical protein
MIAGCTLKTLPTKYRKGWIGMKNDNDIYENIYLKYEVQRRVFLEYLQVMIAREDWHGVADLAMDMRELEAMQPKGRRK